jgi:6,7-dimethyl-8-ribityllumazine synthase
MNEIIGKFNGKNKKIAIIVGRFNEFVNESLLAGAKDGLLRNNVNEKDITVIRVPGALEIPLTAKKLAETKKYDGIIALGAVIRGATAHFEYVSGFSANATAQVGVDFGLPVMNGILTVESIEQAIERAGTKAGNKGWDCALGVLEMIDVFNQL